MNEYPVTDPMWRSYALHDCVECPEGIDELVEGLSRAIASDLPNDWADVISKCREISGPWTQKDRLLKCNVCGSSIKMDCVWVGDKCNMHFEPFGDGVGHCTGIMRELTPLELAVPEEKVRIAKGGS